MQRLIGKVSLTKQLPSIMSIPWFLKEKLRLSYKKIVFKRLTRTNCKCESLKKLLHTSTVEKVIQSIKSKLGRFSGIKYFFEHEFLY